MMSMKYAIAKIGGKQFKVEEGKNLITDKLSGNIGDEVNFEEILLLVNDGEIKIGTPKVGNMTVKAKIIDQFKGVKIRIARYRAKSRYRKVKGFRPFLTKLNILSIVKSKENPRPSQKEAPQTKTRKPLKPHKK